MPIAHLEAPEFIKRVMDGERDFTAIRLTDRDSVGDTFTFLMLSDYLKTQDLKNNPIILNEAELEHIRAGGLWIPNLKAKQASFKSAYFPMANFDGSDFSRSSFFNTDLSGANCQNCNFSNCYFKHTSFSQTNMKNADLRSADMMAAGGLADAVNLAFAKLGRTTVGLAEQKAIMAALQQRADYATLQVQSFFRLRK